MDLAEFLARRKVTLEAITARAREALRLTDGDVLFVCGSLVEGLGNETSDIDLYLVTSRTDITFTSLRDVAFAVGPIVCDVRVLDGEALERLLSAFEQWERQPRQPRAATGLTEDDRKLLHRLRTGKALHGDEELARYQARVPPSHLARHKLDWARYQANTLQIDLAGLNGVSDWVSMLFVAQELLGHAVDGLLAGHGFTNPTRKWRARLLEALPAGWEQDLPGCPSGLSAQARYLALHQSPPLPTAQDTTRSTHRILAFARAAFAWAEQRLLAPALPPAASVETRAEGGEALPALDFDVTVRFREERYELLRLNAGAPPLQLTAQAWSVLSLFDGETPHAQALLQAERVWGKDEGARNLESLLGTVRYSKLNARPPIDVQGIRALLQAASARS
ncbi:hypothetical protein LZ198_26440 [Myxococcus sp. K15C18031901]|uniref:hypothetical protein n=1 Tax=Myxococcus dinghuensis TaxID=2906761 RepID=UPI0020A7AFB2|nr:hypothetical protein [Myxococcus dinghuensis]MCP3102416.1 hypothetical protein [Myxococcus dinghuensis]